MGAGDAETEGGDAAEFDGFRQGYAETIYKGQGKALDHLYHTGHWPSAASYVALTRQRESAQVFVARETAGDTSALARQTARGDNKSASLAWATREELSEARGAEEGRGATGGRETRRAGLWATSEAAERRRERLRARETEARVGGAGVSREGGAATPQGSGAAAAENARQQTERVARLRAVFGPDRAAKRHEEQAERIAQLRAELARDRTAAPDPDPQAQDYWCDLASGVSSTASTAPLAVRDDARLAEFREMDPQALRAAAAADRVGSVWSGRAMTLEDAACLVSPAFAAADQAAQLQWHAEEARAAVERCQRDQRYFGEESVRRWHNMGILRQVMHRSGAHPIRL